jgi:hypothetical protein
MTDVGVAGYTMFSLIMHAHKVRDILSCTSLLYPALYSCLYTIAVISGYGLAYYGQADLSTVYPLVDDNMLGLKIVCFYSYYI